jgi:hypothetical protein
LEFNTLPFVWAGMFCSCGFLCRPRQEHGDGPAMRVCRGLKISVNTGLILERCFPPWCLAEAVLQISFVAGRRGNHLGAPWNLLAR